METALVLTVNQRVVGSSPTGGADLATLISARLLFPTVSHQLSAPFVLRQRGWKHRLPFPTTARISAQLPKISLAALVGADEVFYLTSISIHTPVRGGVYFKEYLDVLSELKYRYKG